MTAAGHRDRRWRSTAVLVLAGLSSLAGCDRSDGPGPGRSGPGLSLAPVAEVVWTDDGLATAMVTVGTDQAVQVSNQGSEPRRLAGDKLDTGILRPGESTTLYLTRPGRFELRDPADPATGLVILTG
jgi:hypothetical protein